MKFCRRYIKRLARPKILCVAGLVFSVFLFGGCGASPNGQDGETDPKLAAYVVELGAEAIIAELDINSVFSKKVSLSVHCAGPNLPPDCDQNSPGWTVQKSRNSDFLQVTIDDPSKAATSATITIDPAKYIAARGIVNWHTFFYGDGDYMITFRPSNVPDKLTLTGNRTIAISIRKFVETAPRQEQPADKPRLGVYPNKLFIRATSGEHSGTDSARISYSGPETQIVDISISGPGASKFSVAAPPVPFTLNGKDSTPLQVVFQNDVNDLFTTYQALLTVTTEDLSFNVLLKGQRTQQ